MFKIGQKVVAIDTDIDFNIKVGDVFTVLDTEHRKCGIKSIDVGFKYSCCHYTFCYKCRAKTIGCNVFFDEREFAPIEDYEAMNEFFNVITEPESVEA